MASKLTAVSTQPISHPAAERLSASGLNAPWLSLAIRINLQVLSVAFSRSGELYNQPASPATSQDSLGKELLKSTVFLWTQYTAGCL